MSPHPYTAAIKQKYAGMGDEEILLLAKKEGLDLTAEAVTLLDASKPYLMSEMGETGQCSNPVVASGKYIFSVAATPPTAPATICIMKATFKAAPLVAAPLSNTTGRAFAVVAEEVRSLARRTSASTKEIEELVRNIQKETSYVQRSVTQGKDKVKEGVKISGVANEALVAIDKSAEDAFAIVSSIAVETTEQAVNIQRITEEAEKNLERVQQVTIATEHQQLGSSLVVKNLEHMRELAHRINSSAQEQAKGNRLYLKSVMEDNERMRELKNEASQNITLARQAVGAVMGVEAQITTNAIENRIITEALATLTDLIDHYRGETIPELDEETINYD